MQWFVFVAGTISVLLLFAINSKLDEIKTILLRESLSRLIGSYTLTDEDKAFMEKMGEDK